jgi:phospholipase C
MAGPSQTVGPMTVHFETGASVTTVEDYWAVLVNVQGGSTPGYYVSSTPPLGFYPNWKECQLQHEDAGTTFTLTVSSTSFGIPVPSGGVSDDMTRLFGVSSPITNVFVLMLENHSFDNIFAMSGISGIKAATTSDSNSYDGTSYPVLTSAPPQMPTDPGHEFPDIVEQLCGQGAIYPRGGPYPTIDNSGFAASYATSTTEGPAPPADAIGDIMACFDTVQLSQLNWVAAQGVVCDNWHASLPGPTWPNRFFLHGASSSGLDSSPTTEQIANWELPGQGFQYANGSIYDRLTAAGIPYRFYNDSNGLSGGELSLYSSNPYLGNQTGAVPQVTALSGVSVFDFNSLSSFQTDLQSLYPYPYTFIEPHYGDVTSGSYRGGSSHHPMDDAYGAQTLLMHVYGAILNSPYWASSLLIVLYDEHGGFYDSALPGPALPPGDNPNPNYIVHGFTFDRYGVRVPAFILSPLIPAGVDHVLYDHASVLATLEKLFGLKPLTERDAHANDLLHLISDGAARTDFVPAVAGPPPLVVKPAMSADEQATIDAQPMPEKGNVWGVVLSMMKAEIEMSGGTPAEIAAVRAKVAAIQTRGQARAYIASVMEEVGKAKALRKAGSPPAAATT